MKTKLSFLFVLLITFLISSCTEEETENSSSDASINFSYTNDGINPSITVNSTSGFVQIENNSTLTDTQSKFIFTFSGVTFYENSNIYAVKNIRPEKKEETGTWSLDDENQFTSSKSKSLDIILVLDVSSSLGTNIANVKESARIMIQQILIENPDAKIGIVKFSEGNVHFNLSSNYSMLTNFILTSTQYTSPITNETYNLESRNATGLYEAILKAIELLDTSNAKGKGIITLTDGSNNYQENLNNDNYNVVVNALNQTDIKHYTIGFVGNQQEVNETILTNMAVNGQYAAANNTNINEVFTRFSNNIATIYDFVYKTNKSPFSGAKEFRLQIELEKVN